MVQMGEQIEVYEKQIEILKGGSSSSQSTKATDPIVGLSKALADLNLKGAEIEKLKKTVATQGEEIKDKDKVIAEYQKLKAKMITDMEKMKDKLSGKPYLIGEKHIIWDAIIDEVGKIWNYFKIIDDEIILTDEVDDTIKKGFQELGTRPQVATNIIKFLNSNTNEVLQRKGVKDRTTMVMEAENIFTKRNLLQQAHNKCIMVKRNIESFKQKFENLVKMGLPSAWNDKGKLLSYESYRKNLFVARDSEAKFQGMDNNLRGKTIVDLLIDDFYLLWQIKNIFLSPPTYEKYTELDIAYRHMKSFNYPSSETWNFFIHLLTE
jgi:hypothetical protein